MNPKKLIRTQFMTAMKDAMKGPFEYQLIAGKDYGNIGDTKLLSLFEHYNYEKYNVVTVTKLINDLRKIKNNEIKKVNNVRKMSK
ncbi:MAG: hypothetical protein LBM38_01965 [Clostridiales bacterium]|jgi:hypothetical protein|nr:hypothetical protein [Clostridiales bacterium]